MKPLAIVSAIGSRGDVNPMLAIARELKRRGWRILFLTSEPYIPLAEAAGFEPHCLVSQSEFDEFIGSPGLWRTVEGLRVVLAETASRLIEPTYDLLQNRVEKSNTILVTHPLDFASRIFRDAHPEVPLVGTVLAPMAIRTPADPARLTGWPIEVQRPQWAVRASYYLADRIFIARWLDRPINDIRHREGLPAISRALKQWYLSPDLVLGLFPDWFAPDQRHWPASLRCTGFPLEDGAKEMSQQDASVVDHILSRHTQPPWVFTLGTANVQAKDYFAMVVEVCRELKLHALLLTEHPSQLPADLPDHVYHESYLPFGTLLPHCRAIVHHGGIGTTSQALASGTPQLVVPMAFDQFDNARRVQQLGCGKTLLHRKLSPRRLRSSIIALIDDESIHPRCQQVANRFGDGDTVSTSVDHIEAVAAGKGVQTSIVRTTKIL